MTRFRPVNFDSGILHLLDQRKLPLKAQHVEIYYVESAALAIREMVVRGAPAIGIAAAYGLCLASSSGQDKMGNGLEDYMNKSYSLLLKSRPTAVNLKWALDKMMFRFEKEKGKDRRKIIKSLTQEAHSIMKKQKEADMKIGELGAEELSLIKKEKIFILTHCNAGSLATGGYGTALGVIRSAHGRGIVEGVFSTETRPRLQGARLTCWELSADSIPCTLICDSMAPFLMKKGKVDAVVTGADRVAANGDAANKTGTYSLALAAKKNSVPFYIAAPISTFDFETPSGDDIEIEYRSQEEVTEINGEKITPKGIKAINAAFDITESNMIEAYITERGIVKDVRKLQ